MYGDPPLRRRSPRRRSDRGSPAVPRLAARSLLDGTGSVSTGGIDGNPTDGRTAFPGRTRYPRERSQAPQPRGAPRRLSSGRRSDSSGYGAVYPRKGSTLTIPVLSRSPRRSSRSSDPLVPSRDAPPAPARAAVRRPRRRYGACDRGRPCARRGPGVTERVPGLGPSGITARSRALRGEIRALGPPLYGGRRRVCFHPRGRGGRGVGRANVLSRNGRLPVRVPPRPVRTLEGILHLPGRGSPRA